MRSPQPTDGKLPGVVNIEAMDPIAVRDPDEALEEPKGVAEDSDVRAETAIERALPLRLKPIAGQRVIVGRELSLTVSAEAAEEWSGRLQFDLAPNSPAGAAIDFQTGAFTFTPSIDEEPGEYPVTVSVKTPDGQHEQATFTVTVTRPVRDEPPVLLVRELRGSAGYGAFRMRAAHEAGAQGSERLAVMGTIGGIRGQRWAVITGLVPAREQEQAFEEFFREQVKPTPAPDVPEYIYYRVEREEIEPYRSPSDPEQPKWTAMNLRAALSKAERNWRSGAPEVVDHRFLHPRLAFPLGPRVVEKQAGESTWMDGEMYMEMDAMHAGAEPRGPWGEEVAHPPQIPLKRHQLEAEMDEQLPLDGIPHEREPDEPDLDMPMGGMPMSGEAGMGFRGAGMGMGMDEYADEGLGMRDQVPDYLLFRFFDYSVEAGKSYRYRVRLMLANPNYGIDPKFLASPELAEKQWIEKDRWSEPTSVIAVPRDTYVVAGSMDTQLRDVDEPSGTVVIVKWIQDTGTEVHKEFHVTRGQQLDYPDQAGETRPEAVGFPPQGFAEMQSGEYERMRIDFVTGMLVLDLVGGNRLPGRNRSMTELGKILVMDHDGTLRILCEAREKRGYERRTSKPGTPATEIPNAMEEEGVENMMQLEGGPPRRPRGRSR
ncbi:MAG: Rib/alpha-like domain-containing protein [Thermoguttaceae bacterium]|nr:Rib/alpha-like domain-containing protein [Thermoguttaceae bacterium]